MERACAAKISMMLPNTHMNMPLKSDCKTSTEIDIFLRHISQITPKSMGLSSSQESSFHRLPGSPDSRHVSYMTALERCFAGYTEITEGLCPPIVIQRTDLRDVWGHAGKSGAGAQTFLSVPGGPVSPPASAPVAIKAAAVMSPTG